MKKLMCLVPILLFFTTFTLVANKTSVSIKGPATAKKGSEVTIVIEVTHKGNSKMHFTDWVTLKFNGKEIKKWQFTKESLPSSDNFKLEYKMTVNEDGTLEAQGHCNLHGSTGPKTLILKIDQP